MAAGTLFFAMGGETGIGAERFSVRSSLIAGGGGDARSVDQRFTVSGSIGQAEAVPAIKSADQRFSLEPGFWHSTTVVQTPGAPELRIRPAEPGFVSLSWPVTATGFRLEGCSDLNAGYWETVLSEPTQTASSFTVTVPASGLIRCYRLMKE